MMEKYSNYYGLWRKFISEYYGISMKEAKLLLTKLYYGGSCTDDIPMILKLVSEIHHAVNEIINIPMYSNI